MPVRTYLTLIAASLGLAAAASLGGSSAAAATYDVATCTSNANTLAPISGADDAWTQDTSDPTHFEFVTHCPPAPGVEFDGMRVQTKLNSGGPVQGAYGQWRFDAPAGTSVTRLRLWREIGKQENSWELYTRTADGTRIGGTAGTSINDSDCDRTPDVFTCKVGSASSAVADWNALSTTGVRVGYQCVVATCATGATLHEAWTAIYGAIVTVNDPTAPTATGAAGGLLTNTYLRGTATATLNSASDATGVRAVQVREGGTVLAQTQRSCDYSRRVPCTDLTAPGSVTVATTGMTDGQHTIQVGASDAAGNFTAATSKQVTVDNTAPAAPIPTSPTQQTTSAPSATISWQAPGGQVAPISAAHITVCSPAACQSATQATGPADGSATVPLTSGFGNYSVLVYLEDAAGNAARNTIATWNINVPNPTPAPAPQPQPTPVLTPGAAPIPTPTPAPAPKPLASPRLALAVPTVAGDRRTLSVRGTVASGVTGRVTVTASARIRGRTRTVSRRATIHNRRYAVRLKLPSTAWTTAKVTVRYPGSSTRTAATVARTVHQRRR